MRALEYIDSICNFAPRLRETIGCGCHLPAEVLDILYPPLSIEHPAGATTLAMASDTGRPFTNKPLPTPTDTPFQTPSRGESRQSSRLGWYSPFPPTSSSQQHGRPHSSGHARSGSQNNPDDDKSSVMDARRFTPNLHASLVSEILSLRREIESKNNILTNLEDSLQKSKLDNGQLTATITSRDQEIRSAKKELHLLESGTLSALGDLAKERDDAVESLADVRKRLEASKNDSRAHEEDARRNQALWEQDKQNWDKERRNIERKVHVTEGRLKTMVSEVAAAQANNQLASGPGSDIEEGIEETWFSNWSDIISTRSSSVRGRYHLSELSSNTYDTNELANLRNSTLAGYSNSGGIEPNSLSLAEELNFDEAAEDHDQGNKLQNEVISPDAQPEENPFRPRRMSVQSQDYKARRILGLSPDSIERSPVKESSAEQSPETIQEKPPLPLQTEKRAAATYQDAETQFTPPSSPRPMVQESEAILEKDLSRGTVTENIANQRRKRTSIPALSHDFSVPKPEPVAISTTASAACQTAPQPTSPPLVPLIALEPMFPEPSSISSPVMISAATQTDDGNQSQSTGESASTRDPSFSNAIPVIAIHPPRSRPGSTYNTVVLPPRTKNVACQTTLPSSNLKSVAVQTEGIRVDKRPLRIPPRLVSAAASSKPQSPSGQHSRQVMPKTTRTSLKSPPPVEPPPIRTRPPDIQTKDGHIAALWDQFESQRQPPKPSSPVKVDNLFAGFSDQECPDREIDFSDDDNIAPIRKTLSKVQNSWILVPASMSTSLGSRPLGRPISDIQEIDDTPEAGPSDMQAAAERKQTAPFVSQVVGDEKLATSMSALPPLNARRAALISSGALAHIRRRSGSEPGPSTDSTTVPPPFPVPTRSSSRKIPVSSSEGNGSPTPYKTSFITGVRSRPQAQRDPKNPLRKVQSAAAVPKFAPNNSRQDEADSPAVTTPALTPLGNPRQPWMPHNESASQHSSTLSQSLEQEASSSASKPADASAESLAQMTSVVDAIAQTMIGEWMWKYVRKRKSFGIAESPQVEFEEGRKRGEGSSGIRHKRWVWLAPYERTVMWSSKQPTNGTALLGKGGRKRNEPPTARKGLC